MLENNVSRENKKIYMTIMCTHTNICRLCLLYVPIYLQPGIWIND